MNSYHQGKVDGLKFAARCLDDSMQHAKAVLETAKADERDLGMYEDCGSSYHEERIRAESAFNALSSAHAKVRKMVADSKNKRDHVLDQRTCNIIMCCKGHCGIMMHEHTFDGPNSTFMEAVAAYMGHECAYPAEKYTLSMLEGILRTALDDYFNVCDNPKFEIHELLENTVWKENYTLSDRIIALFSTCQVRDKHGRYVNGFSEELIQQSNIDIHTPITSEVQDGVIE